MPGSIGGGEGNENALLFRRFWSVGSQETFLAFRSHGISFPEDDEQAAYDLQRDWESLYLGALYRASTLESTSDRFSGMTQDQIYDFVRELEEFAKDFEAHGPGSVGDDLELGLVKMEVSGKMYSEGGRRNCQDIRFQIGEIYF